MTIAEIMQKQSEIIIEQSKIIDSLAMVVLQNDIIAKAELEHIKKCACMIEELDGCV